MYATAVAPNLRLNTAFYKNSDLHFTHVIMSRHLSDFNLELSFHSSLLCNPLCITVHRFAECLIFSVIVGTKLRNLICLSCPSLASGLVKMSTGLFSVGT